MCSTSNETSHKVFIQFDNKFPGVHRQHFISNERLGNRLFNEQKFKVIASSTADCQRFFALAKKSENYAFYNDFSLETLPEWIKEKEDDADKDLNLDEKTEFENKKEL